MPPPVRDHQPEKPSCPERHALKLHRRDELHVPDSRLGPHEVELRYPVFLEIHPEQVFGAVARRVRQSDQVVEVVDHAVEETTRITDVRNLDADFDVVADAMTQRQVQDPALAVDNQDLANAVSVIHVVCQVERNIDLNAAGRNELMRRKRWQTVDLQERVVAAQRKCIDRVFRGGRRGSET